MAPDETQKLALFGPIVENRGGGDDAASDDEDSIEGERRPDAVPFFRHR